MISRVRFALVLGCVVLIALPACRRREQPAGPEVARPVKLMAVGAPVAPPPRIYPGVVRPNEFVEMAFEVPGRITTITARKGQMVAQDELLAQLDARDYRNQFEAARSRRDEAETNLGRMKQAAAANAVAQIEVTSAQAQFDVATAEEQIAQKALDDTKLFAKFDGVVATRYVEQFEQVQAKQHVLSLQQIDVIKIIVDIPERDVATASTDDPGTFEVVFDALPDRLYTLELKEFVTDADPVTQTFALSLTLDAPEEVNILPGMTATVRWTQPEGEVRRDRYRVPSVAVRDGEEGTLVWVVDPATMTVTSRNVELGAIVEGGNVEIVDGLSTGDTIAISGVHHLRDGRKVRPFSSSRDEIKHIQQAAPDTAGG